MVRENERCDRYSQIGWPQSLGRKALRCGLVSEERVPRSDRLVIYANGNRVPLRHEAVKHHGDMILNPSESIMELSSRPRVVSSNVAHQSVEFVPHDQGAVLQPCQLVGGYFSDGLNLDIQQLPVTR